MNEKPHSHQLQVNNVQDYEGCPCWKLTYGDQKLEVRKKRRPRFFW